MSLQRRITLIIMSVATVAAGAVVSSASSFAAANAPAPKLVSPANNTDLAVKDLVLHWKPVAGAVSYEVEVSRNQDWTNNEIALPNGGATVATLFEMPLGLPHATYFWRVRADVGGSFGAWSAPWQFLREWEAPINVVQHPTASDPTLSWAPLHGASSYHVIFDTSPVTADELLNGTGGCFTSNTSYTLGSGGTAVVGATKSFQCDEPELTVGTAYYWGLAAFDDTTAGALTLAGTGGCGTKLPECDALTTSGGSFTYTGPTGGLDQQLSGLTASWHADSATQHTCDTTTPCPTTPTLSWTPVKNTDLYVVDLYLDRDATTTYREYVSQTPQLTPPDQFQDAQPGKPYYWRVEAATCGGTGVQCTAPSAATQGCPALTGGARVSAALTPAVTSTPTPTPTATTAPTPTVTGVSVDPAGPEGDQSMQGGTIRRVTLTGTNITSGSCAVASSGVVTTVPSVTGTTSMSFNYWAPVDGGSVTFEIESPDGTTTTASSAISVDSSAQSVALSAINSFQKRSGPVALTSPADGAVQHGRTVTFKWDDYIANGSQGTFDAENYELEVSTTRTFDTTVLNVNDIDMTQYTDPNGSLANGHYYWRVNVLDETGNELTWSAPREVTLNTAQPTVQFTTADGKGVLHPLTMQFSDIVKHVNSHTVKVVADGRSAAHAAPGRITLGASPLDYVFTPKKPLITGGAYHLVVSPSLVDGNGNTVVVTGSPVRMRAGALNKSKGWHYSHGWTRHRASGTFSGSYVQAHAGRSAHLVVEGTQVGIIGCKGPHFGTLSIIVGGKAHKVSERQSFTKCGIVLWNRALPAGPTKFTVLVRGGTGNFDAVSVL